MHRSIDRCIDDQMLESMLKFPNHRYLKWDRSPLPHLLVASLMLAIAALHTYPLVRDSGDRLPGLGLADNVAFVWNLSWMRQAPASGESFFSTTALMAPLGAALVLHTP